MTKNIKSPAINLIQNQTDLDVYLDSIKDAPFIAVDTEFLRDRTYYPELCLVQICDDKEQCAAIDPLAKGISLDGLVTFLNNPNQLKVLHSGRQDLEIFYELTGKVLHPVFDTQIAATVVGMGESVAYKTLVMKYCHVEVDKAHQFTDWSRRPLNNSQLAYAISDVTYLVDIYRALVKELDKKGRTRWIDDEMANLLNPAQYDINPQSAWERVKMRSHKGRDLVVLRALAAWREDRAKQQNVPRGRVLKDEAMVEIAMTHPKDQKALGDIRFFSEKRAFSEEGREILALMREAEQSPRETWPEKAARVPLSSEESAAIEMLKMLLRIASSENYVSARMIAGTDDLETLVKQGDKADILALTGWRHEVFGKEALDLMAGRLALSLKNGQIVRHPV